MSVSTVSLMGPSGGSALLLAEIRSRQIGKRLTSAAHRIAFARLGEVLVGTIDLCVGVSIGSQTAKVKSGNGVPSNW